LIREVSEMLVRSTLRALFLIRKGVIGGLDEDSAGVDPFALFDRWFEDATRSGLLLPEAMTLSTVSPNGRPSGRLVLLKSVDSRGFVFFTNYESRKASDLENNPNAALTFHWPILQRQVRVEGQVERTSAAESDAYFGTRAAGSQLGAWVSEQSSELRDRAELERRLAARREEFGEGEIPRPAFWGGYRLTPRAIEFWQGRLNRLHDRIEFTNDGQSWSRRRLSP
jgi:pyridoxamine 5'-phosphate oxidase